MILKKTYIYIYNYISELNTAVITNFSPNMLKRTVVTFLSSWLTDVFTILIFIISVLFYKNMSRIKGLDNYKRFRNNLQLKCFIN